MATDSTLWALLGPAFPEYITPSTDDRFPSVKKLSWTGEADSVQPIVEMPTMMLKITGLGCFTQTENLAVRSV